MSWSRCVSVVLAAVVARAFASAQSVPTGFTVDTLATNLTGPNDCCFLPDGRCLIANTAGVVSIFAGTTAVAIGTVANVQSGNESGLLSIAADPAFATNGYLYVYYSGSADAFMHLDRFTCTGDLADAASSNVQMVASSRHVLLGALPDNASIHNGGSLRFGPDGMLYLSVGDDATACNAQSLTAQAGCLLRLEVRGLPPGGNLLPPPFSALDPGTNPLSGSADFRRLLLAHGLRNPFRMEVDPQNGNLYVGDVGLGTAEEYSEYVYPATGPLPLVNFGWPWREGYVAGAGCGGTAPAGLVDPIALSPRRTFLASIIGGACYRNRGGTFDFGPTYEGCAFFADHFFGEVLRIERAPTWGPAAPVPGQPSAGGWATGLVGVTSMRLGPDGGLWCTQHPSWLKRVRPSRPVPSIVAVRGDQQRTTAGEPFAAPLVVQALDSSGAPLAQARIAFTVVGAGKLTTPAVVIADARGFAKAGVLALDNAQGAIDVVAAAMGAPIATRFSLFARRLTATHTAPLLHLSITNATDAQPPLVPFLVLASLPGSPTIQTPLGPFCIDPTYVGALFLEDGTGWVGGVSVSGQGGVGAPELTRQYTVPPGLAGLQVRLQALGLDPLSGWFKTNCEHVQF